MSKIRMKIMKNLGTIQDGIGLYGLVIMIIIINAFIGKISQKLKN